MAFDQGLSGLNSASTQLDVLGNNIANSSTVGFKAGQAQFADVYANSMGGGANVGIGVQSSQTTHTFSQGTITSSTNPLDIAISGQGFFRLDNAGAISYSRNGQFQMDKSGFIVNAQGDKLTGFSATAKGVLNTGSPSDLQINTANLPPNATSTVGTVLNLDSRLSNMTSASFNPTDPTTYNYSTSVSVYDSLGNSHALQTYYVKTGPVAPAVGNATWDVYGTNDGATIGYTSPAVPVPLATLSFKGDGSLDSAATTPVTVPVFHFPVSLALTSGAATPQALAMDFTGTTQYGTTVGVNSQIQNGYTSGQLASFSAGADGVITGTYSNGQTAKLGQVVLANFINPNGLQSLGNNQWQESFTSGAPLVGTPSTSSLGSLQSNAVESSNTDLTAQLVDMITAQRNYQANAQSIKTEDQVMQTLVNLR